MKYEIKGYIFNEQHQPQQLAPGLFVSSYEEAECIFKKHGFTRYLFTLIKKEGE